ncbi:MAG: GLUG motif-containing protein [Candidatus Marinimicrobia bacterium]|nr:GLUG motif-containing protein [Candidatus Neomarinimicrobiota bacterium]
MESPYQIASLANLRWLSENSDKWAWYIYFIQTADIDASETQAWNDSTGFSPIGNDNTSFKGNYNGNGHTITKLYINRPTSDYIGLFGYMSSGELSNLGLIDVNITGRDKTGGLIGYNHYSRLSNCYSSGSVTGESNIGGLIGYINHNSRLSNCYSSGSVTGESNIGGLIGYINYSSLLSNCYSSGSVTGESNIGGLIGYSGGGGAITPCFWDNTVNSGLDGVGDGPSGDQVFGKTTAEMQTESTYTDVGWNFMANNDTYNEGEYWYIFDSSYPALAWQVIQTVSTLIATDVTETTATLNGRLFANGYATTVEFEWGTTDSYGNTVDMGSYGASDYVDISTSISGLTKNTLYHYRIKATHTDGSEIKTAYGANKIFCIETPPITPSAGDGSSENPYQIASLANLRWLSENSDKWADGIYFIQTADIDASETQAWNNGAAFSPIGNDNTSFKGNYNGNGHTITKLYINRPTSDYIGLFGYMSSGELSNLGLIGVNIIGDIYIGGLIGAADNNGAVSNCYSSGSVTGTHMIGGLIGGNISTISNCYASGSVSGTGDYIGGLIGYNHSSSVSNCYSSGSVSGTGDYIGGLLGKVSSGTITACFWDNTVNSGLNGVGDGYSGDQVIGKTTTEMQTESTYTNAGWNFVEIWGLHNTINDGYPHLFWQLPLPRIKIDSIENITIASVDIIGDLLYLGFPHPSQHGFCWNTEGDPTLEDDFIELGAPDSTGVFTAQITGLTPNTLYYIRTYATNEAGTGYSEVISFTTLETAIAEGIPLSYALSQNYPNPFNPTTTLQYGLLEASDIDLTIFDVTGRKIKSWHINNQQPGWHEVKWDGTNQSGQQVSTGVYIYTLQAGDFVATKKMVFMK